MCDESTHLRNQTELSVAICIRYLTDASISIKSFIEITSIATVCDAKAETIKQNFIYCRFPKF